MTIKNPYHSIDELVEDSSIWFIKPTYIKPVICMFEGVIVWYYFKNHGYNSSSIRVKDFPEGEVKEKVKTLIRDSIEPNFHETRLNRYHRWIGSVDVTLIEKKHLVILICISPKVLRTILHSRVLITVKFG